MNHSQKTKTQLARELESLYARVSALESIEAEHQQAQQALARLVQRGRSL